ncbi:MAG: thrombospondin type 3 repeat-containing protein [Myxococcales bacterium]|nr:thrombospondin type 3 repeat-containing protein [Myxococcales bacterium]
MNVTPNRRTTAQAYLLFLASLSLAACGDDIPGSVVDTADDTSPGSEVTTTDVPGFDTTPGPGEDTQEDTAVEPDVSEDTGPVCDGFGCPCANSEDCDSGYCVTGAGGAKSCTQICIDECPTGYECKNVTVGADVAFICVPEIDTLCAACETDLDCGGNRCLLDGSGYGRCGRACSDALPCPTGFDCKEAVTGDSQCVPTSGECPCSELLIGAERTCSITNEFGTCEGNAVCTAAGWSECDGVAPAQELCNAVDDDCDNDIDEGYADLGAACDVPEDGDTCQNGLIACTGDGLGTECAEDTPAFEQCDGLDNDCDGLIDEDDVDTDGDTFADCIDDDDDDDGVPDSDDCAPLNPAIGQAADELCDGIDQDCDGAIDESFPDQDGDSIADCVDPDVDNDGLPNGIDNCPVTPNKDQQDQDGDGEGDACEDDTDGDGISDDQDNCPSAANTDQADFDGDDQGDVCDLDDDADGTADAADCKPLDPQIHPGQPELCNGVDDNCNVLIDEGYADADKDQLADCADNDDDNDLVPDAADCAPLDPAISPNAPELCNGKDDDCSGLIDDDSPDTDGDGLADCVDGDDDGDDVPDASDNCPLVPNPDQTASDGDGKGDACDLDDDGDGSPDTLDCQPTNAAVSPLVADVCNGVDDDCSGKADQGFPDSEGDGLADCVDLDDDNDTIPDTFDNCPTIKNQGQQNSDNDLQGDACDIDDDNDGAADSVDCERLNPAVSPFVTEVCNGKDDNCNFEVDEGFEDISGDGKPDCAGDDTDLDGFPNPVDNCVLVPNAGQENADGDLEGDACDADDDNDGSVDELDCAPFDPKVNPAAVELCNAIDDDCDGTPDDGLPDADQDGEADCLDSDDDGDDIPDGFDNCPKNANPDQKNSDTDLLGNACDSDDDNDGAPDATDCAPENPARSPSEPEVCNGIDDNCSGTSDEGFPDTDSDGAANCVDEDDDGDQIIDSLDNCPGVPNPDQKNNDADLLGNACDVDDDNDGDLDLDDCAPLNPAIGSSAVEACDAVDNDCDNEIDEGFSDPDGDGAASCVDDDDDGDGILDGQDNCPSHPNSGQQNADGDAVGDACDTDDDNDDDPDGTDCAPKNPAIGSGASEACDGIDNDCDGAADEGFPNTDGDAQADCVDPDDDGDGSLDGADCAPLDGTISPNATELCGNGKDDDCNVASVCISGKYGTQVLNLEPYPGTKGVTSFYQYGTPNGSSANTGFEKSSTAIFIVYRDPTNGKFYLVVVLDRANDGSGGKLTLKIEGAVGAGIVLADDPGEFPSTAINPATGNGSITWTWSACCTDGVIIGPLPNACITLTGSAPTNMNAMATFDGTTYTALGGLGTPLQLCLSP